MIDSSNSRGGEGRQESSAVRAFLGSAEKEERYLRLLRHYLLGASKACEQWCEARLEGREEPPEFSGFGDSATNYPGSFTRWHDELLSQVNSALDNVSDPPAWSRDDAQKG